MIVSKKSGDIGDTPGYQLSRNCLAHKQLDFVSDSSTNTNTEKQTGN